MNISIFTIFMTFLWSSLLIILFYILRKNFLFNGICTIKSIVLIYIFIAVRLIFPLEFKWTFVIRGGIIWNTLFDIYDYNLFTFKDIIITPGIVFIFLWMSIFLIKLFLIINNYSKTTQFFNSISKTEIECSNLPSNIKVYSTNHIKSPLSYGIINKIILFPQKHYDKKAFEYILEHELTHHRNNDIAVKLAINILCSFYWWNPFVYLLKKDIQDSLELRCDIKTTYNYSKEQKIEYLTTLLNEFKDESNITKLAKTEYAMYYSTNYKNIYERFELIVKYNHKSKKTSTFIVMIAYFLIIFLSYLFVIQSYFEDPILISNDNEIYFDINDSYLYNDNNKYYLVTPYKTLTISYEDYKLYINAGFYEKNY
ncbi:MAG: M56 family metallopeptidase [Lachnospiraceae bacterium]|nr:M56 family metallopeptidase [Lachnospiraceae bacterium]